MALPSVIEFRDSRHWGTFSFIDLLECNNIPFNYDGELLSFPSLDAHAHARRMWHHLTGLFQIGKSLS